MAVLCKDPASLRRGFVPGHAVLRLLTCASAPDMSSKFSPCCAEAGTVTERALSPFTQQALWRVIAQTVV